MRLRTRLVRWLGQQTWMVAQKGLQTRDKRLQTGFDPEDGTVIHIDRELNASALSTALASD